jgi:hypothetical protein
MTLWLLLIGLVVMISPPRQLAASEPEILLHETFTEELSGEWFWGLGTWESQNGLLRGFESGPRRHGPVKMRRLTFTNAAIEFDFRFEGSATFAGIICNGSQDRGHIVHLVMGTRTLRILAHPRRGESLELVTRPNVLTTGEWHHVKVVFQGNTITATVNETVVTASAGCIAEEKKSFGLGGDSGGPEGEAAGAIAFRSLTIVAMP